jgi:hypothetical protein
MAGVSLHYRQGFKAIHDVLIHEWDPIGIGDVPEAQDEYDSYIPQIYRLLAEDSDLPTLAWHLEGIETKAMCLSSGGDKNMRVARRLREVFEALSQQP